MSAYVRLVFLPVRVDVRAGRTPRPPSLLLSSIPDEILTHRSACLNVNLQEGRSPCTAVHVSLRALAIKPCHAHLWPVASRPVFQLPPGAAVPEDARALKFNVHRRCARLRPPSGRPASSVPRMSPCGLATPLSAHPTSHARQTAGGPHADEDRRLHVRPLESSVFVPPALYPQADMLRPPLRPHALLSHRASW